MPKKSKVTGARALFAAISEWAATLPSAQDKASALAALQEVEEYIQDIRAFIGNIPTTENQRDLRVALEKLDDFLEIADRQPALRHAFGKPTKPARRTSPPPAASSRATAEEIMAKLQPMSVDQVRETLTKDNSISSKDLRALAALLSARVPAKANRDTMAHQITTKIANDRGYRHLSGDAGTSKADA